MTGLFCAVAIVRVCLWLTADQLTHYRCGVQRDCEVVFTGWADYVALDRETTAVVAADGDAVREYRLRWDPDRPDELRMVEWRAGLRLVGLREITMRRQ